MEDLQVDSPYEYIMQKMYKARFAPNFIYNTTMLVPDVVFFSKANPVHWYYMDKV